MPHLTNQCVIPPSYHLSAFEYLAPSSTLASIVQCQRPVCVEIRPLDPVWLLVRLEVTPIENVEYDVAVCSSKDMAIYNAVCLMDKLTNRQFR